MNAPLTIGMATYDDPDGVWFTLQALSMYHPWAHYLVIDNAPKGCFRTKNATEAIGGTYLHRPDLTGTAAPRDALFRLAKTDWVMCLDSHVLLELGGVQALLGYIKNHPDSNDLIQGPLVYDNGEYGATHWEQTTPPGLWGVWQLYPCWKQDEPFDIPMQGLGLFCMRRKAWPGFHPLFRGFGGEEGYIHEKVRKFGGRCLCLPALQWRHRFRDIECGGPPPPYKLDRQDHVWNLLLGHRELGIDAMEAIRKDFPLPRKVFDDLVKRAEEVQPFGVITEMGR